VGDDIILSMYHPATGTRLALTVTPRADGDVDARLTVDDENGRSTVLVGRRSPIGNVVQVIDDIRSDYVARGWLPQVEGMDGEE
jgi:hypothetical protein